MKKLMFILLILCVSFSFAQSETVTTKDGRKVVFKDDKTWEYADVNANSNNTCVIQSGFKEPKWVSTKIRTRNKTRVSDLKRYVSKDTGVDVEKIVLLTSKDTAANGVYILCVDGKKMQYKRNGSVFKKD